MPSLQDIASISPTPRNEGWGTLADVLNYVNQNMLQKQFGYPNPVTAMISEAVGIPAAARVAERLAYGQPITNIGKANVPLIPQDTAEAVGLAAPVAGSYGRFAGRQIGKAIDRAMVENYGPLSQMLTTPQRLTTYHGTPHKFEAFDASKIGTGEGAQVYGHGIYVAENPEVAGSYAANVKDMESVRRINDEMSNLVKVMDADSAYPGAYRKFKTDAGRQAAERYDQLMQERQKVVSSPGYTYKVDLPDEMIDKMLDWDKPLSQQPKEVQDIFGKSEKVTGAGALKSLKANPHHRFGEVFSGKEETAALINPEVGVSEFLRRKGIPGIRYLDQTSRQEGKGTRNFVVFPGEEHNLKILERK